MLAPPFSIDEAISTFRRCLADARVEPAELEAICLVGGGSRIPIVEQMIAYLTHGVALNAVNLPAIMPDQYKEIAPYLNLAERLSMRPLLARCHLGLGRLYRRFGEAGAAEHHLTAASGLFEAMGMGFWLGRLALDRVAPLLT